MTYYINLGGILLYGIKSVNDDSEREITSYDGIGQGFFPVPESRKLRTWTIECEMTEKNRSGLSNWSAASKAFTAFEVLLATKDPSRFLFVSDNRNESMSGYLTGYSKKEEYPGVYSVTIKVTEYKAAGVKTTDVPYIKRPGKAPAIPKTVVFNNKTTPYSLTRQQQKDDSDSSGTGTSSNPWKPESWLKTHPLITDKTTGKPKTNPVVLDDTEKFAYTVATDTIKNKGNFTSPIVNGVFDAFKSISKWFSDGLEEERARVAKSRAGDAKKKKG